MVKNKTETKYFKAKTDNGKLRYDLVPPLWIKSLAKILTFGENKYGANTWQTVPDAKERYEAAMMRHFEAYRDGEFIDPDSGLPHLAHAAWNCLALLWLGIKERENGKE